MLSLPQGGLPGGLTIKQPRRVVISEQEELSLTSFYQLVSPGEEESIGKLCCGRLVPSEVCR